MGVLRRCAGAALLCLASTGAALAQGAGAASGYLDAEHWAARAASRADELGLVHTLLPAQRLVSLTAVEAALREAAAREDAPEPLRALAAAWYARFEEEFPGVAPTMEPSGAPRLQTAAAALGGLTHTGRVAPGRREFAGRTGSEPLRELQGVAASAEVAVSFGSHVALHVAPSLDADRLDLAAADLVLAAGPWAAAVGRQRVGYGWAREGGVVLSGGAPLDRIELATRRPIRLPSVLSKLGPAAFHTFVSRLSEERHPGDPYLWGARGVLRPHPRVELAVQRAAMFGGSGSEEPITARNIVRMLVGGLGGVGFENQVVSVAGRVRLPSEPVLPLTVYAEWGAEDAAGAWWDVPGIVVGVETPAVPGVPALSGGVEFASLAGSCCGNPPWYRHHAFEGSWASRDATLGHPLGGDGSELLGHASLELRDARFRIDGRVFHRDRGQENLFVPGRAGASNGAAANAAWRVIPRSELYLAAAREAGDGWAENMLQAGGRLFLGN